jgi:hypothetical protein
LEIENTLFDGVLDGNLVDFDVDCLVEAMDTVDSLFFYELDAELTSQILTKSEESQRI